MACSKYVITNTGTTVVDFNYRRCDDSMWENQVELLPNQTKNIWLIDGTYSIAETFSHLVEVENWGAFPPTTITATPTPTPTPSTTLPVTHTPTATSTSTPTPTQTGSQTPTPTQTGTPAPTATNTETPTQTPTPTQTGTPTQTPTQTGTPTPTPTHDRVSFTVYSGSTHDSACGQYNPSTTVYGNNSAFDLSSQFWNESTGDSTIDMSGYIQNGGNVVELDTNGFTVGSVTICTTLTPTPTNTQTPTVTPSQTPSPTPTFGYYTYSLGTGSTPNNACVDFGTAPNTIYGTVSGGIGPNIGEFLYTTPGNPPTNPVADGYYSDGTRVFTVSGGSGEITAVDPSGCP